MNCCFIPGIFHISIKVLYTSFWETPFHHLILFANILVLYYNKYNVIQGDSYEFNSSFTRRNQYSSQISGQANWKIKSFYIRKAIEEKLEDLEDLYLGLAVIAKVRSGEEEVLTSEEMWNR